MSGNASRRNGVLGGRPPGKAGPQQRTIEKEAARSALRQIILMQMQELVAAQVANAKGLKYLVTRDKKSGKFLRVTEAMARLKQGKTEELIEVWEKDPCVQAFTDLMNRALDKPAEHVNLSGSDGKPLRVIVELPE